LTPLYHFSNGIKAKIQMPVSADKTFEELIELQLLGKSQKFYRAFYRWYVKSILESHFNRPPTDAEIDAEIASQRTTKYGAANAQHCLGVIQTFSEQYARILQFPMKFKECLRRVIGGRSYGYNLPIFKAFWRHLLKSSAIQNGYAAWEYSDEIIESRTLAFIERLKTEGVDQGWFKTFEAQIPVWRKEHRIKPQRKDAAIMRWLKLEEIRIKILTILNHRISELSHPKTTQKVKVRIKKMSISHRKKIKK
jgi:hypothetical protein